MTGVQRSVGRNGGMATPGAGGRARRQTRYGQGHGAFGHDNVHRAGAALARLELGMPLGLPESVAQDHSGGLQFSTASGIMGVGVAARDNVRSHRHRFGFLVRHPPHVVHLVLRLSDEQVVPTAADEVCG